MKTEGREGGRGGGDGEKIWIDIKRLAKKSMICKIYFICRWLLNKKDHLHPWEHFPTLSSLLGDTHLFQRCSLPKTFPDFSLGNQSLGHVPSNMLNEDRLPLSEEGPGPFWAKSEMCVGDCAVWTLGFWVGEWLWSNKADGWCAVIGADEASVEAVGSSQDDMLYRRAPLGWLV